MTIGSTPNPNPNNLPFLTVDGVHETDIFAYAPVIATDRITWTGPKDFDASIIVDYLPGPAWTRQWSDGDHRIWVPAGTGQDSRIIIKQWLASHDVPESGMRIYADTTYRDLSLIPDDLLDGLYHAAVEWLYSRNIAVRHRIMAEFDIDDEDVKQELFFWVRDYTDRYDDTRIGTGARARRKTTARPTAPLNYLGYLQGRVKSWPQDAARAHFSRGHVDEQLAMHRARDQFQSTHGREPSTDELAAALSVTANEVRRRQATIDTLSNFRNYIPISTITHDADERPEAVDVSDTVTDDQPASIDFTEAAALTRAIMNSVTGGKQAGERRDVDVLGLHCLFATTWAGMRTTSVASTLQAAPKTVSTALDRVQVRLAAALTSDQD
jgi:hypothetical protein